MIEIDGVIVTEGVTDGVTLEVGVVVGVMEGVANCVGVIDGVIEGVVVTLGVTAMEHSGNGSIGLSITRRSCSNLRETSHKY